MSFRAEVREKLSELNLTRKQIAEFARRAALRALPLIGADGHLNFWHQHERLKHLYSYFYAFDAAAAYAAYADDADAAADDIGIELNLRKVILEDIERVSAGLPAVIRIKDYGMVWERFEMALKKEAALLTK